MLATEQDLQKLEQARRESAAKVRALLEQLEAAEKEFDAITKRVHALSGRSGDQRGHCERTF